MADINLVQNTFRREFANHLDIRAVANLPDLQGSGAVRDLREAASTSPLSANDLSRYATIRSQQANIERLLKTLGRLMGESLVAYPPCTAQFATGRGNQQRA